MFSLAHGRHRWSNGIMFKSETHWLCRRLVALEHQRHRLRLNCHTAWVRCRGLQGAAQQSVLRTHVQAERVGKKGSHCVCFDERWGSQMLVADDRRAFVNADCRMIAGALLARRSTVDIVLAGHSFRHVTKSATWPNASSQIWSAANLLGTSKAILGTSNTTCPKLCDQSLSSLFLFLFLTRRRQSPPGTPRPPA